MNVPQQAKRIVQMMVFQNLYSAYTFKSLSASSRDSSTSPTFSSLVHGSLATGDGMSAAGFCASPKGGRRAGLTHVPAADWCSDSSRQHSGGHIRRPGSPRRSRRRVAETERTGLAITGHRALRSPGENRSAAERPAGGRTAEAATAAGTSRRGARRVVQAVPSCDAARTAEFTG